MKKTLTKSERLLLAEAIFEVGDFGYEGGDVFGALLDTWLQAEEEVKDQRRELVVAQQKEAKTIGQREYLKRLVQHVKNEGPFECLSFEDMFEEMIRGITNPWNYGPGYKSTFPVKRGERPIASFLDPAVSHWGEEELDEYIEQLPAILANFL